MRASDAERETVVGELRGHAAAGRLEVEELEERVAAALAAQTREDLAALRRDLPSVRDGDGSRQELRTFVSVHVLFVAIWAISGAGYFWPIWPFLGWGLGMMLHGSCRAGRHTASGSDTIPLVLRARGGGNAA